jgi:novobiocin biosynthesis protein NovU
MGADALVLHRRSTCRLCGAQAPRLLLALPPMPLAGYPVEADSPVHDRRYPIDVHHCQACGLVQLLDVLPDEFYGDYRYTPSHAGGFQEYIQGLAGELHTRLRPATALEIGSSDGALIGALAALGTRVVGFEPSAELAASANRRGVLTLPLYFSRQTLAELPPTLRAVDLVVVRHVMEHLDDFSDVLGAVDQVLAPGGTFVVEVPYLGNIVEEEQYYAFFNEHISYFSLGTMRRLLARHGFTVTAARKVFPEGGSLLVEASRSSGAAPALAAPGFEDDESLSGLPRLQRFADRLEGFRQDLRAFVATARREGRRLCAWGAGQRGVSLLNICGLEPADIECVVDVNPAYHHLHTPGSRIPIVPPDEIYRRRPDGIIVFATGYLDSIRREHRAFEQAGGRFITVVPELRWLDGAGAAA